MERICNLTNRSEKSLERFEVSSSPDNPLIAFLGTKGSIPLVSMESRQVITQLKMSGSVKSAAFSDDSTMLYASGRSLLHLCIIYDTLKYAYHSHSLCACWLRLYLSKSTVCLKKPLVLGLSQAWRSAYSGTLSSTSYVPDPEKYAWLVSKVDTCGIGDKMLKTRWRMLSGKPNWAYIQASVQAQMAWFRRGTWGQGSVWVDS